MIRHASIIAIDPGLTVGIARGRPGEIPVLFSKAFGRDDDDHDAFFGRVLAWIAVELRDNCPGILAIEPPIPGFKVMGVTSHRDAVQTESCFAIIVAAAVCKGMTVWRAKPATWRKTFIGRGDFSRDPAKAEARRMCGALDWAPDSVHSAEAAGIWHWACQRAVPGSGPETAPHYRKALA